MDKFIRVLGFFFIITILYTNTLFAATSATVTWTYVNLREIPSRRSEIITKLVKGVSVTITGEEDEWYKVTTEEELVGWVVKESVKLTKFAEKKEDTKTDVAEPVKKSLAVPSITETTIKSDMDQDERSTDQEKTEETRFEGTGSVDSKIQKTPSKTAAFLWMTPAFLIILCIILFLYYFARKHSSKSRLVFEEGSAITILTSKYIGQKTFLYVLDLLEKIVVITVSGTNVKVLTEIEDSAAVERMRNQIFEFREIEKPFNKYFSNEVKPGARSHFDTKDENFDMLDNLNEKIKKKTDDLKF